MTSTPWREDPALHGCFHEEFPDDLRVIVHEGGARTATARPELMWARVTGVEGESASGNVYRAELLNQPHGLKTLHEGDEILVLACTTAPHPVRVTRKYLDEMKVYQVITPCNRCGLAELFDAPSDLIAAIFPSRPADAVMESFTTFCPLCGGVQMVCNTAADLAAHEPKPVRTAPQPRRWWEFWKSKG